MAPSDRPHDPRITVIQQELFDEKKSKVAKYQDLVVGRPGLGALLVFELVMLVASWVPGALGLYLRSKLFPLVLGRVGRHVVFGANIAVIINEKKVFVYKFYKNKQKNVHTYIIFFSFEKHIF